MYVTQSNHLPIQTMISLSQSIDVSSYSTFKLKSKDFLSPCSLSLEHFSITTRCKRAHPLVGDYCLSLCEVHVRMGKDVGKKKEE